MAEPTVQVPVSLIEHMVRVLDSLNITPGIVYALRALLSQPTPTAEPCHECQYVEGHRDDCGRLDDYLDHRDDAAPPSIADMVAGTTFTAGTRFTAAARRWVYVPAHDYPVIDVNGGAAYLADSIDPSTIRDVQPPAVTG